MMMIKWKPRERDKGRRVAARVPTTFTGIGRRACRDCKPKKLEEGAAASTLMGRNTRSRDIQPPH